MKNVTQICKEVQIDRQVVPTTVLVKNTHPMWYKLLFKFLCPVKDLRCKKGFKITKLKLLTVIHPPHQNN